MKALTILAATGVAGLAAGVLLFASFGPGPDRLAGQPRDAPDTATSSMAPTALPPLAGSDTGVPEQPATAETATATPPGSARPEDVLASPPEGAVSDDLLAAYIHAWKTERDPYRRQLALTYMLHRIGDDAVAAIYLDLLRGSPAPGTRRKAFRGVALAKAARPDDLELGPALRDALLAEQNSEHIKGAVTHLLGIPPIAVQSDIVQVHLDLFANGSGPLRLALANGIGSDPRWGAAIGAFPGARERVLRILRTARVAEKDPTVQRALDEAIRLREPPDDQESK